MKRIIHPILMLFAIIATRVRGGLGDVTLRNSSGEITYDNVSVSSTTWKFPAEYKDNHTLFISVKNVSMRGWRPDSTRKSCIGWVYLPEMGRTCRPWVKCLYYQPLGCSLKNTVTFTTPDIDGVVCDNFAWFRLPKMPAELRIDGDYSGDKFAQLQYNYLKCPTMETEYSTTVTASSTDQTSSVTSNDVTSENLPQMLHGGPEMIVALAIAIGLLVISWVVLGVVIIRNRSKATARNPDVKVTEAEESNTREIVVNAIYGENFERMGDDSQQTSSSAVYSMVHNN
uniref:uncharacterized protein LOC120328849 n=1 Tax=Styela clava TaxID=7725 RepID=UPI0019399800|nr:uncharacterized protein LOC120328849 [Styela clava]